MEVAPEVLFQLQVRLAGAITKQLASTVHDNHDTAISTATTTWSITHPEAEASLTPTTWQGCTEAEVPLTALTYTSAVAEQDARQGTCAVV